MEQNMGAALNTVYFSKSHKFKYFDENKMLGRSNPKGVQFTPPIRKEDMLIGDFIRTMRDWKQGEERLYMQQSLTSAVGTNIVQDFVNFNWKWISSKQKLHKWGKLTSNLLYVSQEGNVTPCHYDEQENFFAQVLGYKRCILFPPDQFQCMYPHPVHHPHDRQSMVDMDKPDHVRFPKFKEAKGVEAVIGPGEVLYIPIYWWHHVESLMRMGPTITVNFWYKAGPTVIQYPLKDHQKVSIMRNIEKMVLEVLRDPNEVGPLLRNVVLGRFED
ncbi:hypoxia-inducible factor 1-alpha inhibitor-like isoform X2 [Harmonia axyridis]|nr:hypoxia-inducible factor 1-alpha inhibitor-like isoform X2 [Harmonia axyridis]